MSNKVLGIAALFGVTILANNMVRADTTVDPVTTTANTSVMDVLSEKAVLSYFGIYRGAPLGDLSNSLQPTPAGQLDPSSPQSIENLVTAGYKIDKDLMVGVLGHFNYFPIGNPVGTGQNLQMLDPVLMVQKSNMIKAG